jgi:hypothetical protein
MESLHRFMNAEISLICVELAGTIPNSKFPMKPELCSGRKHCHNTEKYESQIYRVMVQYSQFSR